MASEAFSIVVPIYNEAVILPHFLATLADGLSPKAEVILVCNGCVDNSADIARIHYPHFRVLELTQPNKSAALRAGDAAATLFPRIYLDADGMMTGGDLGRLARWTIDNDLELASPNIRLEPLGGPWTRKLNQLWLRLPFVVNHGHQIALCFSEGGRARWRETEDVLADDLFMTSKVPIERRGIAQGLTVTTAPPQDIISWICVRARWEGGNREFVRRGFHVFAPELIDFGNKAQLIRLLFTHEAPTIILYLACRCLAIAVFVAKSINARTKPNSTWFSDQGARRAASGQFYLTSGVEWNVRTQIRSFLEGVLLHFRRGIR